VVTGTSRGRPARARAAAHRRFTDGRVGAFPCRARAGSPRRVWPEVRAPMPEPSTWTTTRPSNSWCRARHGQNYFRSREEMIEAVAAGLADELSEHVTALSAGIDDPARRVAVGVRTFVQTRPRFARLGACPPAAEHVRPAPPRAPRAQRPPRSAGGPARGLLPVRRRGGGEDRLAPLSRRLLPSEQTLHHETRVFQGLLPLCSSFGCRRGHRCGRRDHERPSCDHDISGCRVRLQLLGITAPRTAWVASALSNVHEKVLRNPAPQGMASRLHC
jgi:hypothetical protein